MSIYTTHKPEGGSSGLYLKISDGESVKMRIASEPAVFTQEFTNENGETTVSTRYGWTIWNRNEKKAQVFQGGKSIFNQLADLVEEWGEPTDFDITIKRTGTMLETRYSVNPAPKSIDLTKEEKAECDKIDLLGAVKGQWLKDFGQSQGYEHAKAQARKLDNIAEVNEDEPISLEDIPF